MTNRNDPQLSQNYKMFLKIWISNCDLQIVLYEDQEICYLVKYASNPGSRSENVNDSLCSLVPCNSKTEEYLKVQSHQEVPLHVSVPMLIIKIDIRSLGNRDNSKQEIIHLLLQEKIMFQIFLYQH